MQSIAELSIAIAELTERRQSHSRELEEYLLALWGLASEKDRNAMLELQDVFHLLEGAFEAIAIPFKSVWAALYAGIGTLSGGYAGWEETMMKQVVDLHEMREAGLLDNELRYFGLKSPRGAQWYNFHPCSYLDCAAAGIIRAWQDGELMGRSIVKLSNEAGAPDENGMIRITLKAPQVVENLASTSTTLTWDDFRHFLWCGQHFE